MFERVTRATKVDTPQLKYQWQVKHRFMPGFQAGAQGFGELGPWDQWSPHTKQSHRGGPAVFGQVHGQGVRLLEWQAAYLAGRAYGKSGNMLSVRAAYSF